ncbi:MAG TPA: DUF4433 domain-containing protein [Mogibacterium sp.]|nr:DUF4433 domain-containing protein [Mogibacterium sp.]
MKDDLLFVGNILYSAGRGCNAEVIEVSQKKIRVKYYSGKIAKFQKKAIGEFLFFREEDAELSVKELAEKPEYLKYENDKIIEKYNEITGYINFIKILKEHGFIGFHHYTDFTNFLKIMNMGKLFSREKALKVGFLDSAQGEIIERTTEEVQKCVRFYYRDNTPTIWRSEGIKPDKPPLDIPHMPIPVLLIFDEKLINQENAKFADGNAGVRKRNVIITKDPQKAINFEWDAVFESGPYDKTALNTDEIKFKRNAEFLIEDEVDIKYIKKIIFRSEADKKHAISILGENGLFEVNHSKFPNNYAYLSDYCIVKGNGTYYIELKFYLNGLAVERYTHELQITYSDKIKEKIDILYSTERIKRDRIYSNRLSMKFTPLSNKTVEKITYLMDGHISAVWERGKE